MSLVFRYSLGLGIGSENYIILHSYQDHKTLVNQLYVGRSELQ